MGAPTDLPTGGIAAPAPAGQSVADILAGIQNLQIGETGETPKPIGVAEDYVPPPQTRNDLTPVLAPGQEQYMTPLPTQRGQVPFQLYYDKDVHIPATLAVEDVAMLQKAMSSAGLLKGEFRIGLWDKKSRGAFTELLGFANQQGLEWTEALNVYASSASSQQEADDQFRPGRFLPKDPAQYRNTVRDMFRNALGRDPDDDELARYEQELQSTEQGAFREAKAQYGEVVEAGGEMTATEFGGLQSAAEADAAARFREKFEARIAPEQDFQEAQTVNREQGNLLGSILGTVDQVA